MAYHAHLYFNLAQLPMLERVLQKIQENFSFEIGRIHTKPVGPHPTGSCQITFEQRDYVAFVRWLECHRQELDILIHKVTSDDFLDHTEHVSWIGHSHELNLSIFKTRESR